MQTIGFEGRFDYAAIGTVSNVASRLCDEAKPGQILISPRVFHGGQGRGDGRAGHPAVLVAENLDGVIAEAVGAHGPSPIVTYSPNMVSSVQWAGAAIPTTTPRPRASWRTFKVEAPEIFPALSMRSISLAGSIPR